MSPNIKLTCGGCSGAIERVLSREIQAPNRFSVSLDAQQAIIWGPDLPPFEEITVKIAKTGKEIRSKELVVDEGRLVALVRTRGED
ncbi:hypothetical protein DB88DRAFT_469549 [Papiliotrema laurentii]|uniref:HMA domain-containing protein n=1 Tax=Papiliotrema laurentii TaxID=5418 RepID=A0AAD9FIH0_PAPLA|nr:hypothetical protein DB88DRAFT_469549 [Papiliotrema laurentii]